MLYCRVCDQDQPFKKKNNGPHIEAVCGFCGCHIKFLSQNKPPCLYFGKYKGIPIEAFNTPHQIDYLYWIRNHVEIWPKLKDNVQAAINKRLYG